MFFFVFEVTIFINVFLEVPAYVECLVFEVGASVKCLYFTLLHL